LAPQRSAEACEIFRLGILPDGAGDPFHGVIVLPVVERQLPHQMKRVSMTGIHRERALTKKQSFKKPFGPQMAKADFAKSGGAGIAD
jgi:hypothetical protein